jgi:hypothetical protein
MAARPRCSFDSPSDDVCPHTLVLERLGDERWTLILWRHIDGYGRVAEREWMMSR